MKITARITAVILIILGLLIILAGAYVAINGYLTPVSQTPPAPGQLPDLIGWLLIAQMVAGGFIALQGLFLVAIGEALWLLASISDHSDKTAQYLHTMMQRGNQLKS